MYIHTSHVKEGILHCQVGVVLLVVSLCGGEMCDLLKL